MFGDINRRLPYIEVFDGEKSLGKFVDMHTVNAFLKEHNIQNPTIRHGVMYERQNTTLFFDLIRKRHVR